MASGTATATIIGPINLTRLSDLDFGLLQARPGVQGAATIDPASGTAQYSGGAAPACAPHACASPHPAVFRVHGESGRRYLVHVPDAIDAPFASLVLKIDSFTASTSSKPEAGPIGVLDASGRDELRVGATLRVPAGMPVMRVTVVVPVSVSYE